MIITTFFIILAIVLILLGILGLIHPALPGLPLIFCGAWLIAYIGHYDIISPTLLIFFAVITLFGIALDFIAGLLGAKYSGASKTALWFSFFGGIIGIFFLLPGMILGPLIGASVGEYIDKKDLLLSGKVGIGTFIGFIIGVIAKIGCALLIILCLIALHLFSLF